MQLAEEYLKRHSLKVPLIQHIQQGSLFMRLDDEIGILSISWLPDQNGPGKYRINHLKPIHDSYGSGSGEFFSKLASDVVEWDGYEDYFSKLVKKRIKPLSDQRDILIAAWEMFCLCSDSPLAVFATNENLFLSLNKNNNLIDRHANYSKFIDKLQTLNPNLFETWSREFIGYVRQCQSCIWLVQLMDGNGK